MKSKTDEVRFFGVQANDAFDTPGDRLTIFIRNGVLVIGVIFLLWILWNAFHAIPAADDFCYGFGARTRGVFQNVVTEYLTWGGRYTPAFLIGAFAVSDKVLLHYYYIVPLLILTLNFLAARHFLSVVGIKNAAFTLLFFVLLMVTFRMRESLFWLAGGATYGIACALFLTLIAEELQIFRGNSVLSTKRVAILSLASVLLASFNETVMLAHIALLFPLMICCFVRKTHRAVAFVLAAAIAGAIISGAAPGNFLRAATMPQHINVLLAAAVALKLILLKYVASFLVSLLLFYCVFAITRPRKEIAFSRRFVVGFSVFLFFALWASIFARTFVMNDLGPERARTIDFMLVNVLGFLVAAYLHARPRPAKTTKRKSLMAGGLVVGIIAVVASFALYPNHTWRPVVEGLTASADLQSLMLARFDAAKRAKGGALEVAGYVHEPKPITFFNEIKANPAEWENVCFSQYFGLTEVRLKAKPE
ncbi:putative membrane protein [Collimonas arenae]|nr:putative membrane protein [Collimonas arenae]